MARRLTFQALPPELTQCAEQIVRLLVARGFGIRAAHFEVGFPYVPTMHCSRKPLVLLVEIVDGIDDARVAEWVAYCRAAPSDTRFAIGLASQTPISAQVIASLQEQGVGLYVADATGVREAVAPTDQGMQGVAAALPALGTLPREVRVLLGPAYEKIQRGDWREAFQDACEAFEDEARKYLKHWSKTKRILVQRKAGPKTLLPKEINKMTMGGLATAFRDIVSPNQLDTVIGRTLDEVVTDRNLVVHRKRKARTEARLRRNWKGHFWRIVGALKAIHG